MATCRTTDVYPGNANVQKQQNSKPGPYHGDPYNWGTQRPPLFAASTEGAVLRVSTGLTVSRNVHKINHALDVKKKKIYNH